MDNSSANPTYSVSNSPESSTTTSTTASTQLLAELQKALKISAGLDQRFAEWKTSTNKYTWREELDVLASQRLATSYLIEIDMQILTL